MIQNFKEKCKLVAENSYMKLSRQFGFRFILKLTLKFFNKSQIEFEILSILFTFPLGSTCENYKVCSILFKI